MDNLTHSLVGLAAARAGLDRTSPYATGLCIVAANAPDADVVTLVGGQWTYLEQHRGITHSIVGTLVIALILPALFYAGDFLWARVRGRPGRARFGGLLISSLILSASHPLLDWTNSYGVRPLLPWSAEWFYGDLVFILDPYIWLSVGGAAFLLTSGSRRRVVAWALFAVGLTAVITFLPQRAGTPYPLVSRALWFAGLAGLIVLRRARLDARWGRSIAAASLALVVVYWGALAVIQSRALARARAVAENLAASRNETTMRVAATPVLADPLTWRCLAETDRSIHRFDIKLRGGPQERESALNLASFEKPRGDAASYVVQAERDARAEVFLGFARFPATRVVRSCSEQILVQFADLRFTEPGGAARGGFALEVPVTREKDEGGAP